MKTPVRWLDDPTLAAELRADLECVEQHPWQPDLDDLEQAAAALEATLAAQPSPSTAVREPTAAASAPSASALLPKLAVVALSGGLIVSAGVWQVQRSVSTPATAAPSALDLPSAEDNSSRREIEQLQRIYATLDRDPAQAYRLARASLEELPRGPLRQEREGLAVIALWQSGQHPAARGLAERFLARYPESPLGERIRALLASEPSP